MTSDNLSRGARWARTIRTNYDLQEDGDALVTEAARLMDRIDRLQVEIDALPSMTVTSSQGQRIAPQITEQRATITVLQRSLASLGLSE